jgi:hypothetical protein
VTAYCFRDSFDRARAQQCADDVTTLVDQMRNCTGTPVPMLRTFHRRTVNCNFLQDDSVCVFQKIGRANVSLVTR